LLSRSTSSSGNPCNPPMNTRRHPSAHRQIEPESPTFRMSKRATRAPACELQAPKDRSLTRAQILVSTVPKHHIHRHSDCESLSAQENRNIRQSRRTIGHSRLPRASKPTLDVANFQAKHPEHIQSRRTFNNQATELSSVLPRLQTHTL
jgi:hypothetical protein